MRIPSSSLGLLAVVSTACGIGHMSFDPPPPPPDDAGADGAIGDLPEAGEQNAFPKDPIITGGAPGDAAMQFANATPGGSAGPCMIEPSKDALYPRNWISPRFRWSAANGEKLFELKLHTANQPNDLVVYTAKTSWSMDDGMWSLLRAQSDDMPIDVKVRGLSSGVVYTGTIEHVSIAPVDAPGSVVYWTTASGSSMYDAALKGFKIGDPKVVTVLTPPQAGSSNHCVACHTSTPDGQHVGVNLAPSDGAGGWATADLRSVDGNGTQPGYLTQAAKTILARPTTQLPIFSKGHWTQGDRVMGATYSNTEIIWIDVETQSTQEGVGWGAFTRTGDANAPAMAAFSHDGQKIVYTSTADPQYGAGAIVRSGQLRTIPWNARKGGTASPIAGSHLDGSMEYYASFSADDRFVAFTRAPENPMSNYDNPQSESFLIPAGGGTALRLAANDPPSCMSTTSPGVTNAWPKWSPDVLEANGRKYYFVVFSSRRDPSFLDAGGKNRPQLYVTTVIDDNGKLTSTGALYIGNQPNDESNHTPAWDSFAINIPH